MKIEQLKPSQRVAGRWLAVMEDGSILRLGENEVLNFSLYAGRELTDQEAEQLTASAEQNSRRERALNLAAGKPMSRRELERKLAGWGAGEEEQAAVCGRLEELGILNDAQYAQLVVRHYSAKGYGERKLRDELYRRGGAPGSVGGGPHPGRGPGGGHRRLCGKKTERGRCQRPQRVEKSVRRPGPPGVLLERHLGGPAAL